MAQPLALVVDASVAEDAVRVPAARFPGAESLGVIVDAAGRVRARRLERVIGNAPEARVHAASTPGDGAVVLPMPGDAVVLSEIHVFVRTRAPLDATENALARIRARLRGLYMRGEIVDFDDDFLVRVRVANVWIAGTDVGVVCGYFTDETIMRALPEPTGANLTASERLVANFVSSNEGYVRAFFAQWRDVARSTLEPDVLVLRTLDGFTNVSPEDDTCSVCGELLADESLYDFLGASPWARAYAAVARHAVSYENPLRDPIGFVDNVTRVLTVVHLPCALLDAVSAITFATAESYVNPPQLRVDLQTRVDAALRYDRWPDEWLWPALAEADAPGFFARLLAYTELNVASTPYATSLLMALDARLNAAPDTVAVARVRDARNTAAPPALVEYDGEVYADIDSSDDDDESIVDDDPFADFTPLSDSVRDALYDACTTWFARTHATAFLPPADGYSPSDYEHPTVQRIYRVYDEFLSNMARALRVNGRVTPARLWGVTVTTVPAAEFERVDRFSLRAGPVVLGDVADRVLQPLRVTRDGDAVRIRINSALIDWSRVLTQPEFAATLSAMLGADIVPVDAPLDATDATLVAVAAAGELELVADALLGVGPRGIERALRAAVTQPAVVMELLRLARPSVRDRLLHTTLLAAVDAGAWPTVERLARDGARLHPGEARLARIVATHVAPDAHAMLLRAD